MAETAHFAAYGAGGLAQPSSGDGDVSKTKLPRHVFADFWWTVRA